MFTTRARSVTPNVRWRSARRRSNEKSAKQIRRETPNPSAQDMAVASKKDRRALPWPTTVLKDPLPWMVKDAIVDYVEDGPARRCRILEAPFVLMRISAHQWCVLLDKVRGWVPIETLRQVTSAAPSL
jgi:hypothetical protein